MSNVPVDLQPLAFDGFAPARDEPRRPLTARIVPAIRKTAMRFVQWIDGVDMDGQAYWS